MDERDVTCGELLTKKELKTVLKSAIMELTEEEQKSLLSWIREMKANKENAQ